MATETSPASDRPDETSSHAGFSISRFVGKLMPIALLLWLVHYVGQEYGILAVSIPCAGFWGLWFIVIGFRQGMTAFQNYRFMRFGIFLGFMMWAVCLAPIMYLMGYEDETAPRKERDDRFAKIDRDMRSAAARPILPFESLTGDVSEDLAGLPNHPVDRPEIVKRWIQRLKDPDPKIRAQVVLALGHYESQTSEILPLLEPMLADPEPRMRAAATVALSGMRPWNASLRDCIFAKLDDPDGDVRMAALTAVGKIIPMLKDEELELLRRSPTHDDVRPMLELIADRAGRK